MASRALPLSKLQKRRRRRLLIRFGILAGIILALFSGVVALARAPFLRIKTVTVSGAQTMASSTIELFAERELGGSYFWLFPKNNILLYPQRTLVTDLLASFPRLKSVSVRARSLTHIECSVSEREPVAQWCGASFAASSTPCFLLDDTGKAYAPAPRSGDVADSARASYFGGLDGNLDRLPAQFLTPPQFASLQALVKTLAASAQASGSGALQGVGVDSYGSVRMEFQSGFEILFNLSDNAALVAQHFSIALSTAPFTSHRLSDFAYLDVRFGDKLYYKFKQ